MQEIIKKADVLIEALPYIKKFRGKTFVIKYGGSILSDAAIRKVVLDDIMFLYFMGINVILVHGGGPNISGRLKEKNLESKFVNGIRVTCPKTLEVVKEELRELNEMLQKELAAHQAVVAGIKGTNDVVYCKRKVSADADYGLVGDVIGINKELVTKLIKENRIVILKPTGVDRENGAHYNVNADEVASFVAGVLKADKFVLLTNVSGVMMDPKDPASLVSSATEEQIKKLIADGVISGGMIPKVTACLDAIGMGVDKAHILDAAVPHALLMEIFTDKGIGTEIVR